MADNTFINDIEDTIKDLRKQLREVRARIKQHKKEYLNKTRHQKRLITIAKKGRHVTFQTQPVSGTVLNLYAL